MTDAGITSEQDLRDRLAALGDVDISTRNAVTCSLIGHSRVQHHFFGSYSCARCGAQLGDALGGYYSASDVVIVGHNCETCRKNYAACTWKDKIFSPDPFAEE